MGKKSSGVLAFLGLITAAVFASALLHERGKPTRYRKSSRVTQAGAVTADNAISSGTAAVRSSGRSREKVKQVPAPLGGIELRPVGIAGHELEERRDGFQGTVASHFDKEGNPIDADRDFYAMRAYPNDTIPPGARAAALNSAVLNNGGLVGGPGEPTPPGQPYASATWVPAGPSQIVNGQNDLSFPGTPATPVSGRLTAIAVHPTNPAIVYAGGAQGGVWKTVNANSPNPTWSPLTDRQPSMSVGALAIDPVTPNIIYVGTGEPNSSGDSYYGQGILRSLDGGNTWSVFAGPGVPFASVGAFVGKTVTKIVIDPATAGSATTTVVWAATNTGSCSSGVSVPCSLGSVTPFGLWRSTDSGQTWTLQTVPGAGFTAGNFAVDSFVLDPTNHDTMYVGVRNLVGGGPANSSVWKSTNAATGAPATFAQLSGFPVAANGTNTRKINLAIGGSTSPMTLYAAVETAFLSALYGLFRSTDGGTTWNHVEAGNGTGDVAASVGGAGSVLTATAGTFSPNWTGRHIILTTGSGKFGVSILPTSQGGFISSTQVRLNAAFGSAIPGVGWSVANYPSWCDGQCFYDMSLAIDPTNATASTVYVGGNPHSYTPDASGIFGSHSVWRTDDAAVTWTSISEGNGTGGVHTDDHALVLDTSVAPAILYDGNDGGIWRSTNKGLTWTDMNTDIAITQFQSVSTHPSNPTVFIGGTQDNGTNLHNPAVTTLPAWNRVDGGDGGQTVIDQRSPARMFHTYFNARSSFMGPAKNTTGGVGAWDFVGSIAGYGGAYYNGIDPREPVLFYAPIEAHPASNPSASFFANDILYQSPDPHVPCCDTVFTSGCGFPGTIVCNLPASWTAVSPVLTKDIALSQASRAARVSAIGVLPNLVAGKEVIYSGATDGRVEVSSTVDGTGVATWTILDGASTPMPTRSVSSITVDARDATGNTAYVVFSGFNGSTPTKPGHVFRTVNGLSGAATFTNLSGDLPDIPSCCLVIDPGRSPALLYVGTDIGVFRSEDDGAHWFYLSNGFPVVAVFDLERNPTTGQIIASTHGRGMFQLFNDGFPDTTSPLCGGSITGTGQFTGTALDAGANDTGIASIVLLPSSSNLVISSITYSSPGSATYIVTTINHLLPGSGTVRVTDYAGNFCDQVVSLPAGAPGAGFFTLTPCRAVDTRAAGGAIAAGTDRTFFLAGTCGIPADATALAVNVTVTQPTAGGDLRVFPAGTSPPLTSVINFSSGQTRANNAIVQVSTSGGITVHSDQASGSVQFILDVDGYFK